MARGSPALELCPQGGTVQRRIVRSPASVERSSTVRRAIAMSCALAAAGCAPTLSRSLIAEHPALAPQKLGPVVVESSQPLRPDWILRSDRGPSAHVAFVGQASANGLDSARAEAMRDLLSAVANFVAVEVESSFESIETDSNGTGTQDVRSSVKSHARAALREVHADTFYWEKVAASPLDPSSTTVRYYVHAEVPKAEISRARLEKQLERQRESGRTMVALIPLVAMLDVGASDPAATAIARAMSEDLARGLAADTKLHVVEPSVIGALLGDAGASELERLEVLQNALLADRVISGTLQKSGDQIRVRYAIQGAQTGVVEGTVAEIFALEAALLAAIQRDLGANVSAPPPASGKADVEAHQLYAKAWEEIEAGHHEAAIALLLKSLELRPTHVPTYLRLGHLYERLGRYGKIQPLAAQRGVTNTAVCREESRRAAQKAYATMQKRALDRRMNVGLPPWIQPSTPTTDAALILIDYVGQVGMEPHLRLEGPRPTAAVSAYLSALVVAHEAQDLTGEREARLALGDLAVRVDRAARAVQLYRWIYATAAGDQHWMSLANYGLGVAYRRLGQPADAVRFFEDALQQRVVLGEKPYLLEIYNELGGALVELSELSKARAMFRRAARIADDLGAEYFRAVLANNLGVLAWREGRTAEAEEGFRDAYAYLSAREESEGTIAAALNGAEAAALRGDGDEARRLLGEASRRVEASDQEGRLAALEARRGALLFIAGQPGEALEHQHHAWALATSLGEAGAARRARAAILAAEARLDGPTPLELGCLRNVARSMRTVALHDAPASELVIALETEIVLALAEGAPEPPVAEIVLETTSRRPYDRRGPYVRPDLGIVKPSLPYPVPSAESGKPVSPVSPVSLESPPTAEAPHERMLGVFETEPESLFLLSPRDLARLPGKSFPAGLIAIAARAEVLGVRRIEAASRLDLAALLWRRGMTRDAYRSLMQARQLYAGLGDAAGLAASHEWIGFMMRESAAVDRAVENLALARSLYQRVDDSPSADRVLGWGE